ncbi:MAG: class I SAM-dependent methyltransferase [Patescibacteria group bacterium]
MIFPLNYIKKSPHRNCLEKHLQKELPKLDGSVLDIGSGGRRYDFLLKEKPKAIDTKPNEAIDIKFGDVNSLQYDESSFDNILCVEVLEYVKTPQKAVEEILRVLKPKGTLILSVPFMYKAHEDFLRFTRDYLKELFIGFSSLEVLEIGNFYTIILDVLRGKIAKLKFKPLKWLLYLLYIVLVLFIPLSRLSKDKVYASGYLVIAKK